MRRIVLAVLPSAAIALAVPSSAAPQAAHTDGATGYVMQTVVDPPPQEFTEISNMRIAGRLRVGDTAYQVSARASTFRISFPSCFDGKCSEPRLTTPVTFTGTSPAGAFQATCSQGWETASADVGDSVIALFCDASVGSHSGTLDFGFTAPPQTSGILEAPAPMAGRLSDVS
jgi:hypothetical protein